MPAVSIDGCLCVMFGTGDMHIGFSHRPGGTINPAIYFSEGEPLPSARANRITPTVVACL